MLALLMESMPTTSPTKRFLRSACRVIVSATAAVFSGAVLLQAYFSIFAPSGFGRFAEFPVIVIYSSCIVGVIYLLVVIPAFSVIRRRLASIPLGPSAAIGAIGGLLLMLAII